MALRRGNGQTLAALGATALEHQAAVFGRHPGQESVGLGTVPPVGLESTLHDLKPLVTREKAAEKPRY